MLVTAAGLPVLRPVRRCDVVARAMVQPPACGVNEEGGGEVMNDEVSVLQPLYGRWLSGCANLKQDQQSIYRP